ncbi:MAG TPA: CaiB/BaiF CoA-transferase family protein [Burkholderiaceae bacterium]|nr:CaiB/BaiF CoA-transferase family protein [Burkholderiaceae bacterium]
MTAPLSGVTVLDMTRLLPGPAATMHLADLGADVIKVEDTSEGDYMRAFPPTVRNAAGTPVNPSYEAANRGKRSIAIDLKRPEGRALLLRLARRADALIEGFRPGVLERLGLGWDALHAANPRLVVCSLSGYGQSGPLSQRAGHDLNYIAMTGVLDQVRVDGEPAIPNLQMGDLLGGTLSALSMLLAALLSAQRTGQGRYLDVAMTDGLLAHHFFPHAELDAGAQPVAQRTLLTGGVACYRVYRTADDRHLAVGALEFKFWKAFCDAVGLPELVDRHWAHGEAPGSKAAQDTIERVARRIAEKTADEWESVFAKVDCCVTPVLTPAEALAHPHHRARGLVQRQGDVTEVGPLAQVSGHQWTPAPAPAQGEHTRAILAASGLDGAAIDALVLSGVVREH